MRKLNEESIDRLKKFNSPNFSGLGTLSIKINGEIIANVKIDKVEDRKADFRIFSKSAILFTPSKNKNLAIDYDPDYDMVTMEFKVHGVYLTYIFSQ